MTAQQLLQDLQQLLPTEARSYAGSTIPTLLSRRTRTPPLVGGGTGRGGGSALLQVRLEEPGAARVERELGLAMGERVALAVGEHVLHWHLALAQRLGDQVPWLRGTAGSLAPA